MPRRLLPCALLALFLPLPLIAQDQAPRAPRGWAVDHARRSLPPLMPWQRNLDDALAVQRRDGRPLLICVNMDTEPASESLAWGRYRDPQFAALAAGFVCLIASPDRREPLDRDDRGARLPDQRFGRIVNTEAIAIEPVLFERYFAGDRTAPRHIGIAADGTRLFDIVLSNDLTEVDEALRKHGKPVAEGTAASALTIEQLLASPDARDRDELEARFRAAAVEQRYELAAAAGAGDRTAHPELLQMALRDEVAAVREAAAKCLAAHPRAVPLATFPLALRVATPATRALLVTALRGLGEPGATFLADAHDADARLDEPAALALYLQLRGLGGEAPAAGDAALEQLERDLAAVERRLREPGQDALRVPYLALLARYGMLREANGGDPTSSWEELLTQADKVVAADADSVPGRAARLIASWRLGRGEAAVAIAIPPLAQWSAVLDNALGYALLSAHTAVHSAAFWSGVDRREFDPAAATSLAAAHRLLVAHPLCTAAQAASALEFFGAFEVQSRQTELLDAAQRRWPWDAKLHDWRRWQLLRDGGADALERHYRGDASGDDPVLRRFAATALLVAAEQQVRCRRTEAAAGAYRRALAAWRGLFESEQGDVAAHFAALSASGLARVLAARGELAAAADAAVEALTLRPASAGDADGLQQTPAGNAVHVRSLLRAASQAEAAARIDQAAETLGITLPEANPERRRRG